MSLQGYTGPAPFRKLGYNTEVLGFEAGPQHHSSAFGGKPKSLEGLREGTQSGVRLQKESNIGGLPRLSKLPDGCGGRSPCLQRQMAF